MLRAIHKGGLNQVLEALAAFERSAIRDPAMLRGYKIKPRDSASADFTRAAHTPPLFAADSPTDELFEVEK